MNSVKRPRGRPRGSGKNDMPALAQVADLLVQDGALKATTAMNRVMRRRNDWGATEQTLRRRWQGKWKVHRDRLMAEARERVRPKPAPVAPRYPTPADIALMMAAARAATTIDQATLRAAAISINSMKDTIQAAAKAASMVKFDLGDEHRRAMKVFADYQSNLQAAAAAVSMQRLALKPDWDRGLNETLAAARQFSEANRRALEAVANYQNLQLAADKFRDWKVPELPWPQIPPRG